MNTPLEVRTDFLEVTFKRATAIWWALLWRALLFGFLSGALIGFVVGFMGGLIGASPIVIRYLSTAGGAIVGIPVGIVVVQLALRKKYREFSIRLVAH